VSLRDTVAAWGAQSRQWNWRAIVIGPSGTGDGLEPLQRVSVPEGPLTIARRFQRRVACAHTAPRPGGTPETAPRIFPPHVAGRIRRCEIPATGCSPIFRLIADGLMILVKVQVSLRDTVAPWLTHPASELAGYFQWSLRDLSRRYARTIPSNPLLTSGTKRRSRRACPERSSEARSRMGTSDNSPAFPTPGRSRTHGTASRRDA
jgi:hypothetical protein